MSRRRRSLSPGERLAIWWIGKGKCWICNEDKPGEPLEVDHPHSWANGGGTTHDNARLAHRYCNRSKRTRTFVDDPTTPKESP